MPATRLHLEPHLGMRRVLPSFGWSLALLAAGCGGGAKSAAAPTGPAPVKVTQVLALDQLVVLEMHGPAVVDTAVTITPGKPRIVIVRHAAPDNNVFAEVTFPATVFAGDSTRDSVVVTFKARPGIYGLTVASDAKFGKGARITFKYPVHFQAPATAITRYGTAQGFERALRIAALQDDGRYGLLVSSRPSTDNLSAPIPGPGTYLAAAPLGQTTQ
jgi:hypothetical protein